MKSPVDRDFGGEAAYTEFAWKTSPIRYEELPQFTDLVLRTGKCFVVEDEIWLNGYPEQTHDGWWDSTVGEDYDRHYEDPDPHQVLHLRFTQSGPVVVNKPELGEATNEAIARTAHVLKEIQVPGKTEIQWNAGIVTHNAPAQDYYDHIR